MTPKRAMEIYQLGSRFCNWSEQCTEAEKEYVMSVWDKMNGSTCWYDALVRIVNGKGEETRNRSIPE